MPHEHSQNTTPHVSRPQLQTHPSHNSFLELPPTPSPPVLRPISPPKELLQLLEEQGDFFLDGSEDEKEEKMEIGVEQEKGEKVGKFFAEKGISTTFQWRKQRKLKGEQNEEKGIDDEEEVEMKKPRQGRFPTSHQEDVNSIIGFLKGENTQIQIKSRRKKVKKQ